MKKFFSVTIFTALLTFLRMGCGLVIGKFVAIYTGPTGLALLGQLQTIANILNGIANAPAGNGIVRYTAEHSESGHENCAYWWRACSRWIIILCGIMIPLVCVTSPLLSYLLIGNKEQYPYIIIIALTLPVAAYGTMIVSILNGYQSYKYYVLTGIISVLISALIMILLTRYLGIRGALYAASFQAAIIGIVTIALCIKKTWFKIVYFYGQVTTKYMYDIRSYIIMTIASALSMPLALIIIRRLIANNCGWDVTGQWQAVWKISEAYLAVITLALSTYYLPHLSKIKDNLELKKEVFSAFKVIIPVTMLLSIGMYLCRDNIINLLFDSKFSEARSFFLVQLIGDVIKIASWLIAFPMLARGKVKWFVYSEIIFALNFIFLGGVYIHFYGAHGANYAYLTNYVMYFITIFLFFDKIIEK